MKECTVLFNEQSKCNLRKQGQLLICDYMNQKNGMCMHKEKNKYERKNNTTNNGFFRKRIEKEVDATVSKKESGYVEDILPHRY